MSDESRGPGVRFPPPLIFVAGLALAKLLDEVLVFTIAADGVGPVQEMVGSALALAGLLVMAWGLLTFARAGTAVYPNQSASRLVRRGPYAFTRNPMYVGLTTAYVGGALVINSAWALLLLPLVLWSLTRLVIRREERHLRAAFGADYDAYCARVRRWL